MVHNTDTRAQKVVSYT